MSKYHSSGSSLKSLGPEGRKFECLSYQNKRELQKNLSKTLSKLITEDRFSYKDITVLSMKNIETRSFLSDNTMVGNYILTRKPKGWGQVKLSTVHSFKGLENKIIIITDIDDEISSDKELMRMLCYVGFSRARNHLILMGDEKALKTIQESNLE